MNKPLASIGLDADNFWSYKRTHGDADWVERPSYLPVLTERMITSFSQHQIKPSVFVVGADAAAADGPDFVQALTEYGCEIGSHSYEHEPWLHLYSPQELRDELKRTEDALQAAGAPKPRGFRAPGFAMSPDLMRALVELDYDYDCSVLATWIGPVARQYYLRTNKTLTKSEREDRKALFGSLWDAGLPNKPFTWKAPCCEVDGKTRPAVQLTEVPVTVFPMARVPIHASYVIYLSGCRRTNHRAVATAPPHAQEHRRLGHQARAGQDPGDRAPASARVHGPGAERRPNHQRLGWRTGGGMPVPPPPAGGAQLHRAARAARRLVPPAGRR